jgi:predicted permease
MNGLHHTLRSLKRSPGFAFVAILSLGLGIGANVAISSVIRAVLLDPLPVKAPQELFEAGWKKGNGRSTVMTMGSFSFRDEKSGANYSSNFSYSQYRAFQQSAVDAEVLGFSYTVTDVSVSSGGQPMIGSSLLVSGNFFPALGVSTALGRPLADSDDRRDAQPVAVITHAFWQRAFGADPNVVGRTVHLNGVPFVVAGVTAPGFYGMSKGGALFSPSDIFLPLATQPLVYTRASGASRSLFYVDDKWWLHVMARVKPGRTSLARLESILNTTFRQSLSASSLSALQQMSEADLKLFPGGRGIDVLSRPMQQPLLILGAVVAIVLLIACVNVANLMLARGVALQKEISIRLALGAGRWRLLRGILTESMVLASSGGILALIIGSWGGRVLLAALTPGGKSALDVPIDIRLLALTLAISVAATVLFAVIPALRVTRLNASPSLKQVAAGSNMSRLRGATVLMAAQVGISVPLLVGAALFLHTVFNLGRVDLGFNPQHLTMFHLDPSLNGYDTDRIERLYGQVLQRVGAIPGVSSITVSDVVLMSRLQNNWSFYVDGTETKNLKFARVGPAYFETMGIPMVAGRAIGIQDHARAGHVAVVNESAAKTLFGNESAVGRRVTMKSDPAVEFEIVGVVKDSRYTSPRDPMGSTIYLPYGQTTLGRLGPMTVILRAGVPQASLAELIRAAMADVDRDIPVVDLRTQAEQIDQTLGSERTFMRLLIAFGAFALLLACIGLHGITSYSVTRRTSEIGVRVALGAQRGSVLWLIFRQVVMVTIVGLLVGIPASIALSQLVRATLYGIEPSDPLSFLIAVVVMTLIPGLAGFVPVRRAARLDPLKALRYE